MFAILAAICFGLAFFFHGGAVSIHSAWFDPTGLLYLGLTFLAIHVIPAVASRVWFRK
jgi:hypothetical protein